jgi:hypothetical protein
MAIPCTEAIVRLESRICFDRVMTLNPPHEAVLKSER